MADPRTIAAKLTAQFRSTFADELRSVVVFGSLPRGESIPGVSDLNILILLESMTTRNIGRAAPLLQQWIRSGNTPPYVYSWDEWSGMQDTFAIEIADMNDARDVLWGVDPIDIETLSYANLRMQTEREIRDTLLQLRLRLMVATTGPLDVGALLMSGMPSFSAYMRAALRLANGTPGLSTRPTIESTAKLIDADPSAMLTCLDARRSTHRLEVQLNDPITDGYLKFVDALLQHIDRLPNSRGPDNGEEPRSSYTRPATPAGAV